MYSFYFNNRKMTTKAIVVSLLILCACLAARAEYLATWIEGPNGEMPNLGYASQIQDSKGNIWLFGGTDANYADSYNDVWKLDVRNNYTWSAVLSWPTNDTGNIPPQRGMEGPNYRPAPRFDALTWIDRDDNLWIYGGTYDRWYNFFADLWMFNTTSSQWKFIHESIFTREWGTKGKGVYNVTTPGISSGSVTWTNFTSNELWFLAGGDDQWRSDVWKYSIDNGVWTWMAGPNARNVNRTEGIQQRVWYSDSEVTGPPAWESSFTIDPTGDVWFRGGNIPGYYLNDELWRFRPSTLQWMWVSGEGYDQVASLTKDNVQPASAYGGTMAYIGNNVILYWPGYVTQSLYPYSDQLFSFNTSSMMWTFESGSLNETYLAPQYSKFRQADAGNSPGTRGELNGISLGSLWIVRGYSYGGVEEPRDTFVFSVDICQNDLNPCDSNAKCTAYTGYADCKCNSGYEGDGYTCTAVQAPISSSSPAASEPRGSNAPSSKTSASNAHNWTYLTTLTCVAAALCHLLA